MDPQAILDQAIALVKKVNAYGVAAETALIAFKEKLYPTFAGGEEAPGETFGSLPAEAQAAVEAAVEATLSAS